MQLGSGTTFTTSGHEVEVGDSQWFNGTWTSNGNIAGSQQNYPGGSAPSLHFNNANGDFHIGSADELELLVADLGGNSNLRINGEFANLSRLIDADGTTLGGVAIEVNATQSGNNWIGTLELDGFISQFALGG